MSRAPQRRNHATPYCYVSRYHGEIIATLVAIARTTDDALYAGMVAARALWLAWGAKGESNAVANVTDCVATAEALVPPWCDYVYDHCVGEWERRQAGEPYADTCCAMISRLHDDIQRYELTPSQVAYAIGDRYLRELTLRC